MSLIDIDTNSLTNSFSAASKNLPRIFMHSYSNAPPNQPQSVASDFPQLVSYGLTSPLTINGQPNNGSSSSAGASVPLPNPGVGSVSGMQQTAFNSSSALTNYSYGPALLNTDDKTFDNVIFDILKVDPEDIAVR
jgi:hypothetical protein